MATRTRSPWPTSAVSNGWRNVSLPRQNASSMPLVNVNSHFMHARSISGTWSSFFFSIPFIEIPKLIHVRIMLLQCNQPRSFHDTNITIIKNINCILLYFYHHQRHVISMHLFYNWPQHLIDSCQAQASLRHRHLPHRQRLHNHPKRRRNHQLQK